MQDHAAGGVPQVNRTGNKSRVCVLQRTLNLLNMSAAELICFSYKISHKQCQFIIHFFYWYIKIYSLIVKNIIE